MVLTGQHSGRRDCYADQASYADLRTESALILPSKLPNDLAKVIRVLLNDPARLLQASWLGLGLGLIGIGGVVRGRALNLDRQQPIELNQRTYRSSSLSKQSRSSSGGTVYPSS